MPELKRKRPPSKTQRWADLCKAAGDTLLRIENELDAVETAINDLDEMRQEYSDTYDNMPQNLQGSAYGEKLSSVANLNLEDAAQPLRDAVEELRGVIDEAEGVDLPLGFGRD
jgi:hypothetical protein